MTTNSDTLRRYQSWAKTGANERPEILKGIRAMAKPLPLDADGLGARGWTELPIDFVPEDGGIMTGGYMEDRSIYNSPVFASDAGEPRTLHLGLDVFAAPGTSVFAPVEGYVHSFQVNGGQLDYGPTIILQHELEDGLVFWTLYGHLSEESLFGLEEGDLIAAGETLAELGEANTNGGWAPHLHFQIMLDLQGRSGDFPGVCKRSERDKWAAICPDPSVLLGLK